MNKLWLTKIEKTSYAWYSALEICELGYILAHDGGGDNL